jgi:hypothetical protein
MVQVCDDYYPSDMKVMSSLQIMDNLLNRESSTEKSIDRIERIRFNIGVDIVTAEQAHFCCTKTESVYRVR